MKGTRLRWNTVVFLISWDEQMFNHASTDLGTNTGPMMQLRYEFLNHCIGNILELCSSEAKQSPSWIYLAKVKSVIFQLSLKMMFSRYKLVWLFDYNQDRYFFIFGHNSTCKKGHPRYKSWPIFDAQFHNGIFIIFLFSFHVIQSCEYKLTLMLIEMDSGWWRWCCSCNRCGFY